MIKELVKIANRLDNMGLKKEADAVDRMIRKIAVVSRESAPTIDRFLIEEFVNSKISEKEQEMKKKDFFLQKFEMNTINYLKSFLNNAGDRVFITTEDNYFYELWLEDPLDPKSAADPRKENGMSIRMTERELVNSIGKEHLNHIKESAKKAGYILIGIKKSGYGEWQFTGDLSQLEESGYGKDVLI